VKNAKKQKAIFSASAFAARRRGFSQFLKFICDSRLFGKISSFIKAV
jgi:hypothetical protein